MKRILLLLSMVLAASGIYAQHFRKGALYQVDGIPTEYKGQLFVMDELSAAMNLFNKKKKQENKQEKNESVSGTITGDK